MLRKQDRDIIRRSVESYVQTKNKLPCLEDLGREYPALAPSVGVIIEDKDLVAEVSKIYAEIFEERVSNARGTRMRQLFKEAFARNQELFLKFSELNVIRENRKTEEFQEVGKQVQELVHSVEDSLLSTMEMSRKHNSKSSGVADKFHDYVKLLFPLYDEIGTKYRMVGVIA